MKTKDLNHFKGFIPMNWQLCVITYGFLLLHSCGTTDLMDYCTRWVSLDEGLVESNQRMKFGRCTQKFHAEVSNKTASAYCRSKLPIMDVTAKWTDKEITCTWERTHSCEEPSILIEGNCYLVLSESNTTKNGFTFDEASAGCNGFGYDLARITSKHQAVLVRDMIDFLVSDSVWVGNAVGDDDSKEITQELSDPHNPNQQYIKTGVGEYGVGTSKLLVLFVMADFALNIRDYAKLIPADKMAKFPILCTVRAKSVPLPKCPSSMQCDPPVDPVGPLVDADGTMLSLSFHVARPNKTDQFATTGHFHELCQLMSNGERFALVPNSTEMVLHVPVEFDERMLDSIPDRTSCTPSDPPRFILSSRYMVILPDDQKANMNESRWSAAVPQKPNSMCADMNRIVAEAQKSGLVNVPFFVRHPIRCGSKNEFDVPSVYIPCSSKCGARADCNADGICQCTVGNVASNITGIPDGFDCRDKPPACYQCIKSDQMKCDPQEDKCICAPFYRLKNKDRSEYQYCEKIPPCQLCDIANATCDNNKCQCKPDFKTAPGRAEGHLCQQTCIPMCIGGKCNTQTSVSKCDCDPGKEVVDGSHPTYRDQMSKEPRYVGRICADVPQCQCKQNCHCPNRWVPDDMRCNPGYFDVRETQIPSRYSYKPNQYCFKCKCISDDKKQKCGPGGADHCVCNKGFIDAMDTDDSAAQSRAGYQRGRVCLVEDCSAATTAFEVTFIIDESGSIGDDWKHVEQFLFDMGHSLPSRVATVKFVKFGTGSSYHGQIRAGWNYMRWENFLKSSGVLNHAKGDTATSNGLQKALQHAGHGRRIFVLITDGYPNYADGVRYYEDHLQPEIKRMCAQEANRIKSRGITLIAVGVSGNSGVGRQFLYTLTNQVYMIANYGRLKNEFAEIFKIICRYA